uniref:Uncharacterized protein n=1 Tax=Sphaerodactylus townsendi TaxID=933632 RepID=A0ACB8FW27_9SAUR
MSGNTAEVSEPQKVEGQRNLEAKSFLCCLATGVASSRVPKAVRPQETSLVTSAPQQGHPGVHLPSCAVGAAARGPAFFLEIKGRSLDWSVSFCGGLFAAGKPLATLMPKRLL